MSRTANTSHPALPSSQPGSFQRVKLTVVSTSVQARAATAKPTATTSRPPILARLLRPRLRSWLTLIQSSSAPTTPAAAIVNMTSTPLRVKTRPSLTWAAP
jgi:hypothetical protein